MLFKKVYHWGDKLEDKVRGFLSHFPIIYAFIGGAGVIIFWRGIWVTNDYLVKYFTAFHSHTLTAPESTIFWWDGPFSILLGTIILLLTGLFVSSFIGNEIIISGLKGEKRVAEKSEQEIKEDVAVDVKILNEIKELEKRITNLEKK